MDQKNRQRTRYLCQAAVIAALYVVLTLLAKMLGLDSGVIQVRFSEMLCILPIFLSSAIPGVTVGCFLASLLTGAVWLDIIIGPIATLIGAIGTYLLRKYKWIAPMPPIVSNAIIIPFVLAYGYGMEQAIPLMMLTVAIGEIISVYILGMIFYHGAEKYLKRIKL